MQYHLPTLKKVKALFNNNSQENSYKGLCELIKEAELREKQNFHHSDTTPNGVGVPKPVNPELDDDLS
jgi:antitoxin component HigA of HigAB toxin-antitoxin module